MWLFLPWLYPTPTSAMNFRGWIAPTCQLNEICPETQGREKFLVWVDTPYGWVVTHCLIQQGDQQKKAIYVNEDKNGDSARAYRRTDGMCHNIDNFIIVVV